MMKRLLYIFFIVSFAVTAQGQRREISQARQWVKRGNNLDKAEKSMRSLLNDSTNRCNKKIWLTLFEAVRKQYEQGNEKLYLKQKYDTTRLFSLARNMFEDLQAFDSIDALPNKRGKIAPAYRSEHAQYLHQIRPNLFNGGAFFLNKKKYAEAYQMYNTYIQSAYEPLFEKYQYVEKDRRMPEASYWAAFSAYQLKKYDATLKHSHLALKDSVHYPYLLQYLANIYEEKKDTIMYLKILDEGFTTHPSFPFFFPRLVDYYVMTKQFDNALDVIDRALAVDSTNQLYQFAKSTVLLNTGRYDACIQICDDLIAKNDSMPEPYLNAGLAYFNQAVLLDHDTKLSKKNRKQILGYYHKALPYLARYRALAPEMKDKWGTPLYTIYLNLNMGKEFEEIDRIINQKQK